MGPHPERGQQYRVLARLDPDLQQQVLAGRVDGHSIERVMQVARMKEKEEQRTPFDQLLRAAPSYHEQNATNRAAEPIRKRPGRGVCAVLLTGNLS